MKGKRVGLVSNAPGMKMGLSRADVVREIGSSGMDLTENYFKSTIPKKIYLLCEEKEGNDGIRYFSIKKTSYNEESCKSRMNELIEADEEGFIAKNGIEVQTDTCFRTYFDNGFLEYYVLEEKITE